MTIEKRLEQVEQQNQKIQRTNKRLTVAFPEKCIFSMRPVFERLLLVSAVWPKPHVLHDLPPPPRDRPVGQPMSTEQ